MKKLNKLFRTLLAFILLFGNTIIEKSTEIEATEIQPYAMIIDRELNDIVMVKITDGTTYEYAAVYVGGTYRHNLGTNTEYATNVNVDVRLQNVRSYVEADYEGETGTFILEISNITFSAANKKLVISCNIEVEKGSTYKNNSVTFSV